MTNNIRSLQPTRIGMPPSTFTGEEQTWLRRITDIVNTLPPVSTFSHVTPESNVSAIPGTVGINLNTSSSTLNWLKATGYGNIGWVPAGTSSVPGLHVLATTVALGAQHTVSGLTARQVLIATGATTALFRALTAADVAGASDVERTFASSGLYIFTGPLTVSGLLTANGRAVISNASAPVLLAERTSSDTSNRRNAAQFLHTSSADMIDGQAASIQFALQDSAAVINAVGDFAVKRSGADNTGTFLFLPFLAGVATQAFQISPTLVTSDVAMTVTGLLTASGHIVSGTAYNIGGSIEGLRIGATTPGWALREGAAAANSRVWRFFATGSELWCGVVDDAITGENYWLRVLRSGTTVTSVTFPAPVTVSGLLTANNNILLPAAGGGALQVGGTTSSFPMVYNAGPTLTARLADNSGYADFHAKAGAFEGLLTASAGITAGAPINTKGYTVATLPAGTLGDIAHVTDAVAPAFLTAVLGGGAVKSLVFYNGANWVAA